MRLTFCLLMLVAMNSHAEPVALRYSIADSWAMPMVGFKEGEPAEGIMYDIMLSLAQQVGHPATFRVLAQARLEGAMDQAMIDVRCLVTPEWLRAKGDYVWSQPFLEQHDVLVSTRQHSEPVNVQELPRQSIGTVLNYIYPSLQPLFDAGKLQRDNARSQQQVLQMLIIGRFNYAVSNHWAIDWINRDRKPQDTLHRVAHLHSQTLACMVRNDPSLPVHQLLTTLAQMQSTGEIDRIINRYTSPSAP